MKTTKGFVPVRPDGTFVYLSEWQTHGGTQMELLNVDSIEKASFLVHPSFGYRPAERELSREVNFVPVEERREVVLLGYGKEKSNGG